MQTRQFHSKSRNGCQSCKQRHVKCDEQGPPCANCIAGKVQCVYNGPRARRIRSGETSQDTLLPESTNAPRPAPSTNTSSIGLAEAGKFQYADTNSHRLMELELMHLWTSKTWEGFCSIREEQDFVRNILPRLVLKHEFLFEGMFAVTALDIAANSDCSDTSPYIQLALETYQKSSAIFRQRLVDITPKDCHAFFAYSVFTVAVNLMIPEYAPGASGPPSTALEAVKTFFTLARGAHQVAYVFDEAFSQHMPHVGIMRNTFQSSPILMNEGDRQAIGTLDEINDCLNPPEQEQGQPTLHTPRSTRDMYHFAIRLVEIYYAEDYRGAIKGMWLSAPNKTGDDFAAAVDRSEPMAMLVLMHWAILLERTSHHFWWTKSIGRKLVEEISPFVWESTLATLTNVPHHIAWIRREVGLD